MPSRSSVAKRPLVGFTLVELLVVVTVVAIMAAIAVPSFTQMIANARVRSAAGTLQAALLKARSEALKRNCRIELQDSAGGWSQGWQVVIPDLAACGLPAGSDPVLQSDVIEGVDVVSGVDLIAYQRSGRADLGGAASLVLRVSDTKDIAKPRCVLVSLDGIPRVLEQGASGCPVPP
jgi:type IV fimbrial biogenesis protein FimT